MVRPLILSAIVAAIFITAPVKAAGDRAFTLANTNAKASVDRVWYTQTGSGQAYQEIILTYPIRPNSKSDFTVPASDYCLYDVRIKFSDGTQQEINNVNVCRGATVTAS